MKRLTKRGPQGYAYFPACIECLAEDEGVCPRDCPVMNQVCERLAQYEDAAEKQEGASCK